jgi:hypothetical protein
MDSLLVKSERIVFNGVQRGVEEGGLNLASGKNSVQSVAVVSPHAVVWQF